MTKPADKPDARQDQARNLPSACAQITPKTADEYLVDRKLLGLDTATAAALGHAAALATTTTAATLTTEASTATVAATAAVTAALTLATVAARHRLETVVRRSGSGRSGFGRRLRVVVSPGLRGCG